jgi:membrane protein YdbS with pleckstrin-like domain
MQIIQQTSKLLQFRERSGNGLLGSVFAAGLFMALPAWRLWVSYSEFQYVQLKCEAVSVSRSEPCTLTNVKAFTTVLESEPVKSVRVYTEQYENSTKSTLILLTAKGEYDVPGLSNQEVNLYSQKIEKMLESKQVLASQLDALIIEKDVRSSSLIWGIVWSAILLLLAFISIGLILDTPTHTDWKFDKNDNSLVIDFHQFSRHIYHDKIPLDQVQKVKWTAKITTAHDDYGRDSREADFCVELVLQSGEVIPLIPSKLSNLWSFKSSEAFATTISHFLDVEVPELSEIIASVSFGQAHERTTYMQEQAQLKKQRLSDLEN